MAESRILIAQQGNQAFIKIVGEGTFQNAGGLKKAYLDLLKNGVTDFILDLGACELLDSTLLGILLGLGLRVKEKGSGHVRVLKANQALMRLFENLGLNRIFTFDGPDTRPDSKEGSE